MSTQPAPFLRISPESLAADFPGYAFATDAFEASIAGARVRISYWSPESWARTPEESRPPGAVPQKDGAFILIEPVD